MISKVLSSLFICLKESMGGIFQDHQHGEIGKCLPNSPLIGHKELLNPMSSHFVPSLCQCTIILCQDPVMGLGGGVPRREGGGLFSCPPTPFGDL